MPELQVNEVEHPHPSINTFKVVEDGKIVRLLISYDITLLDEERRKLFVRGVKESFRMGESMVCGMKEDVVKRINDKHDAAVREENQDTDA